MSRGIDKKGFTNAVIRTDESKPCAFCGRTTDNDLKLGKFYTLGHLSCHYFCALLSSFLIQRGSDDEGMLGFLLPDLEIELERCKKMRCVYCGLFGATMVCCSGLCKKRFHLPCGQENDCMPLFYNTFQTFCSKHRKVQKKPPKLTKTPVMYADSDGDQKCSLDTLEQDGIHVTGSLSEPPELKAESSPSPNSTCSICMEDVVNQCTPDTIWPPCCGNAGDRWFHRECLERLALSAGQHYLKCPLCNDKAVFCRTLKTLGIYVPDQDASWEAPGNGWFDNLYRRYASCDADVCLNPRGRTNSHKRSSWELLLCATCGSYGCHRGCLTENLASGSQLCCAICRNVGSGSASVERRSGYALQVNLWEAPQISYLRRINRVSMQIGEADQTFNCSPFSLGNSTTEMPGCSTGLRSKTNKSSHKHRSRRSVSSKKQCTAISKLHKQAISNLALLSVPLVRCNLETRPANRISTVALLEGKDDRLMPARVAGCRPSQVHAVSSTDSAMETDDYSHAALVKVPSCDSLDGDVYNISDSDESPTPGARDVVSSSTSSGGHYKLLMCANTPFLGKKKVRQKKTPIINKSPTNGKRQLSISDFFKKLPD